MRILLAVVLVGCGGESSSSIDAPASVDAYDTARCLIQGNYGSLGQITGTAGNAQGATTATFVLDPGPPGKDDLFFRFVAGRGAFAGGIMPGTYPISGVDTDFNNCGLCTNLIADIIPMQGPSKFYFVASGTVTLTTVTAPITGSVSNLRFIEVTVGGTPVPDGCTASINSASFTAN